MKLYESYIIMGLSALNVALGTFTIPIATAISIISGVLGVRSLENSDNKEMRQKINTILGKVLKEDEVPKILNIDTKDNICDIGLTVPPSLTTEKIREKQLAIEQYINKDVEVNYNNGFINLKISDALPSLIQFELTHSKENMFFIGFSKDGKEFADLDKNHILVGGSTRSGKTFSIRSHVVNDMLVHNHKYIIADFMKIEFADFENLSNVIRFISEVEDTQNVLNYLLNEMNRRLKLFEEVGAKNFKQYNKKVSPKDKLDRIIFLVDEFADIRKYDKMMDCLNEVIRKSLKVGINVILSTQKPTEKNIPTDLKSNMTCRIGFGVNSNQDSRNILDVSGAELIKTQGRALIKNGPIKQIQCMYLNTEIEKEIDKKIGTVKELLKGFYVDKKEEIFNISEVVDYDFTKEG